jgi:hypothetical protein
MCGATVTASLDTMESPVVDDRIAARHLILARRLVVGYLVVSLITVVVLAALQWMLPGQAGTTAWIRGCIVAASSILMLVFAGRAAAGDRRALLRWRIVVVVMIVAIGVIVSISGFIPVWMRLEQVLCGIMLIGVAVLILRRRP